MFALTNHATAMFGRRWPLPAILGLVLTACVGNHAEKIVDRYQFVPQTVSGGQFLHQVFLNQQPGETLHVYIEGDGRPWRTPNRMALDPTAENPVMLQLMSLDTAPAMYLGRPCYHKLVDPGCSPVWWTDRRYAEEIVHSLNRVIDQFAKHYRGIVLFGHSGGGTLAMLLAARRQDVQLVVTLAGNLNTETWAQYHGYTPLQGSLNPYTSPPLDKKIRQLHLIGDRDSVITVEMLSQAIEPQPNPELRIVHRADHACCWAQTWPMILSTVGETPQP